MASDTRALEARAALGNLIHLVFEAPAEAGPAVHELGSKVLAYITALEADKARLDWLELETPIIIDLSLAPDDPLYRLVWRTSSVQETNLRAAIDAARASTDEEPTG